MKKSRFTEEQIVRILKEVEAGGKVVETCRNHGIGEATYYKCDVPPVLSSGPIWSPIPPDQEIGREEAVFGRTDHWLPA